MRRGRADEGQASVELALVLPLVMMLLLAVVQLGLLVRDQILVVHAAREAVRDEYLVAHQEAELDHRQQQHHDEGEDEGQLH
ncbi:MAG TPA: TadE/TadG family type IV pilus assembly protein [Acidimicrobiales bacterium]|nr:TadE/TadG family type IV pilus assembly protein [Acidimicrobiales bacterium]